MNNLMEQIKPFQPGFTLGERAETLEKQTDGTFIVTTNKGTRHHAPVVAIAGGLGSFEPRKPPIPNIADFEEKGVSYFIKDPEVFRNKKWSFPEEEILRWIGPFILPRLLQMSSWCTEEMNSGGIGFC